MCSFVCYYDLFIFLGLKFRNSRQLSNEEKALLLIENLQTDDHLSQLNGVPLCNSQNSIFSLARIRSE